MCQSSAVSSNVHPPANSPAYRATALRHPKQPLVVIPQTLTELTGPVFGRDVIGPLDHDLTRQHPGEPLGQRIVVEGRVLDEGGRPVPHTLVEVWQANAAGRYAHKVDQWRRARSTRTSPAAAGRSPMPRAATASYRSGPAPIRGGTTTTPGAPRTSTSRCSARRSSRRLVTQMYFPGDPLLPLDPIFNAVPDARARERMVATFDLDLHRAGVCARLPVRSGAARAAIRRRWWPEMAGLDAVPDRGPVPAPRPAPRTRADDRAGADHAGRDSRPAARRRRRGHARRRARVLGRGVRRAWAGCGPRRTAATGSRDETVHARRPGRAPSTPRTSPSGCWRAASSPST